MLFSYHVLYFNSQEDVKVWVSKTLTLFQSGMFLPKDIQNLQTEEILNCDKSNGPQGGSMALSSVVCYNTHPAKLACAL